MSYERCCSGLAIPYIYECFRINEPNIESPLEEDIKKEVHAETKNKLIFNGGLEKKDKTCEKVVEKFASIYGAEAGNLCLKTLPRGGLYLLSGITLELKTTIMGTNIWKVVS